jgi:hypothetical protein
VCYVLHSCIKILIFSPQNPPLLAVTFQTQGLEVNINYMSPRIHLHRSPKEAMFCTNSVNICINSHAAYHDTEKGGEGERDTGITSEKGVTRHVARGYLCTYSLDRWRDARESSPPPPIYLYLFWTV